MYAYPSCFSDDMVRSIADAARVVKYVDLPLQHINDQMLGRMRRRVTRAQTELLLDKLRKWVPDVAIRTTFIAGAPGETDPQHQELVQFVRDFGFDAMGVFPYSREHGTAMGRMEGQVPDDVKRARVEELMLAQQQVAFARAAAMAGRTVQVLVDAAPPKKTGRWIARTRSQAPEIDATVLLQADRLHPGQLLDAKITGAQGYDLLGELAAKKTSRLPVIQT